MKSQSLQRSCSKYRRRISGVVTTTLLIQIVFFNSTLIVCVQTSEKHRRQDVPCYIKKSRRNGNIYTYDSRPFVDGYAERDVPLVFAELLRSCPMCALEKNPFCGGSDITYAQIFLKMNCPTRLIDLSISLAFPSKCHEDTTNVSSTTNSGELFVFPTVRFRVDRVRPFTRIHSLHVLIIMQIPQLFPRSRLSVTSTQTFSVTSFQK